jgi:hypothetical protein
MGVRGKGRRLSSLPCSLDVSTGIFGTSRESSALAGVEGEITPTHTQGRAAMKTSPAKASSIGFSVALLAEEGPALNSLCKVSTGNE